MSFRTLMRRAGRVRLEAVDAPILVTVRELDELGRVIRGSAITLHLESGRITDLTLPARRSIEIVTAPPARGAPAPIAA